MLAVLTEFLDASLLRTDRLGVEWNAGHYKHFANDGFAAG